MPGHKNPFRREKRPLVTVLTALLSVALFLGSWGVVWAGHRDGEAGDGGPGPGPTVSQTAVPPVTPGATPGTATAAATPTRTSRAS